MEFATFWMLYPKRVARLDAMKAWNSLTLPDRRDAIDALPVHVRAWDARGERQFIPHAGTWIRGRRWEDEVELPRSKAEVQRDLAQVARPGESWDDVRERLRAV